MSKEIKPTESCEEIVDEMVRDFTAITPRPKSEIRRRLNDLITKAKQECKREACNEVLAWLGYWRDKMPPEAVEKLQDITNYRKEKDI